METDKPLIEGEKVKEILKKLGLKTSDLQPLENVSIRRAQYRAKDGMSGLAAVCLLLLDEKPELLARVWDLAGHPERATKTAKK